MSKLSEITEKMPSAAKMTSLKIDPKIRYLADLASTVTKQSLTAYIESALLESFAKVTLRVPSEPEPIYGKNGEVAMPDRPDPETERVQNEAMTISNRADDLWSESEFGRIESLSILARRLVPDEDYALLQYIRNRKDLRISSNDGLYKLNREKINSEWELIKAAFAKAKGKGK
ncbi:MAG TPA: hypothetical protein VK578_03230 [Edaphobacter sp.]|nr:hypothetical protein [Edaphobacter sp.]